MLRKIKVSAQFSGVLPVGNFANMRPGFSAEMEWEEEFKDKEILKFAIETAQQELQAICYGNFEAEANKAKIIKIQEDLKNFRFYDIDGEKYPSVTSISGYDQPFWCSEADLPLYAAQGNIIDAEIRNYVKTGKWASSADLLECTADRHIIKTRVTEDGKHLSLDGWNFLAFLEKHPIKNMVSIEKPVVNKKMKYAGTPDLIGEYNGLKTLVSIKRSKSKVNNFIQDSAYAKCDGMEDIKQIMIVEMKSEEDGGNKQGWSKPSLTEEIDKYFELFTRKRKDFEKLYGI